MKVYGASSTWSLELVSRLTRTHVALVCLFGALSAGGWSTGCAGEPSSFSAPDGKPPDASRHAAEIGARRIKVDPEVWARFSQGPTQRVIVEVADPLGQPKARTHAPASPSARALQVKQRRIDLAARKKGVVDHVERRSHKSATVRYAYEAFRLIALEVDAEQVEILETDPEVTAVFVDHKERAQLAESLPYCHASWFQQNRGSGSGTSVAILDTPIRYDQGAFGTCPYVGAPGCSVVEWLSFSDETPAEVIAKEDEYGETSHGTNVAAIALGVAPDTELLGLNVFHSDDADQDVTSYVSDQVEALDWVAAHAAAHDIVAVNMSVGGSWDQPWACNYDDARYDPIRTLRTDYDILTVISSGNDGEQTRVTKPGCLNMGVTVAAQFDTDLGDYPQSCSQPDPYVGEMACFSNLNGMVDLVAPGVHIDAGGLVKSGTSMAAPHVAGAIAAWQSLFLAMNGTFKSAPWMHRRLLADSTLPMAHSDGRRFSRLAMNDGTFDWDDAHAFTVWHRESSSNSIRLAAPGFQETATVTGLGYDIDSVYLYLEVLHLQPQDVEVTLRSPSGVAATVRLPAGQPHFNGILGRMIEPGAFASLAGSPADGTWTLSLRDTHVDNQGNYIQAALFFVEQGCTPRCDDEGCGDDRCGGSCGELCEIEGACYLAGATQPGNACLACVPNVAAADWSPVAGSCDDGDPCTEDDTCSNGTCGGSPVVCPPPVPCNEPGSCNRSAGHCVYPQLPDGTSCSDGDSCTYEDVCQGGVCTGTATLCAPPGECRQAGGCDSVTHSCVYPPVADGTPCPYGVCLGGVCFQGRLRTTPNDEDGGCSCSTTLGDTRSSHTSWWGLLALPLLLGWRLCPVRRRREGRDEGPRRR